MDSEHIQELAAILSVNLVTQTRPDGSNFITLVDGAPSWCMDVLRFLHADLLPNNTIYDLVRRCAGALAEVDANTFNDPYGDALRNAISEIEPDVYNHDLIRWLGDNLNNGHYVDCAINELGVDIAKSGIWSLLQAGQQMQIEEIGINLINQLETLSKSLPA